MRLPRRYRAKSKKYRKIKVDEAPTPRAHSGETPRRPTNLDDYSCWTDRSAPGTRDNSERGPMDALDPEKPQGMY